MDNSSRWDARGRLDAIGERWTGRTARTGGWVKYVAAAIAIVAVALLAAKLLVSTQVDWKDGSPAWSPDGKRIAFYSERDGNAEIYVMNADGTGATRLTRTSADEGYPCVVPRRTHHLASTPIAIGNFDIFAMNPDGSNVRPLTRHPARDVSATWSPDGADDRLHVGSRGRRLRRLPTPRPLRRRRAARMTRTGTTWFPVFSPDGQTLAFHVGRDVHTPPPAERRANRGG